MYVIFFGGFAVYTFSSTGTINGPMNFTDKKINIKPTLRN